MQQASVFNRLITGAHHPDPRASLPGPSGDGCSEVKEEPRAKPVAGDMSGTRHRTAPAAPTAPWTQTRP